MATYIVGAVGDGITDNTAAFNAAAATNQPMALEPGNYLTQGGHNFNANGQALFGDASGSCIITNTSPSSVTITIGQGTAGAGLRGVTLSRSCPPVATATGISYPNTCNFALLDDVISQHNWTGFVLGPTGFSTGRKLIAQYCSGVGYFIRNTPTDGAVQWSLDDAAALQNASHGFYIEAIAGPPNLTLGTWQTLNTFANTGCGLAVVGLPGCPIYGVRIRGAYLGADASHELYMNTYGGMHEISNIFTELAGVTTTGPAYTTKPSNAGSGVCVDINNQDIRVSNIGATHCSTYGFEFLNSTQILPVGCATAGNLVAPVNAPPAWLAAMAPLNRFT